MKRFFLMTIIILGVLFFLYPNFSSALTFPNDPYYGKQWYLNHINLPAVWDYTTGSEEVVITLIDSGVDIDHPDLKENIWVNKKEIAGDGIDNDNNGYIDDINGWDFINNVSDPRPKYEINYNEVGIQHGTVVAGVLAARGDNKTGITGVSWKSKIMPLRAMNSGGGGNSHNVIQAIDYAVKNGADIINMSFVGESYSKELFSTIKNAYDNGVLIVTAAGNYSVNGGTGENLDLKHLYPICYDATETPLLLGVAATDSNDYKARFSNYGSQCIDISAPGTDFFSTKFYDEGGGFTEYYVDDWSGTSLATPLVSGTAALVKSLRPDLSPGQLIELLLEGAQDINTLNPAYQNQLGRGRLNAEKVFLSLAKMGESAPVAKIEQSLIFENGKILIAGDSGFDAAIHFFVGDEESGSWRAYENFRGGLNIAVGDLDGNGSREIITAVASAGGSQIKIFDTGGKLLGQFMAYRENFRGGVNVATGDVNGDGRDEIITAPASNNIPQIRIFDSRGEMLGEFLVYGESFRGGVNLATGDVNGDGRDEIITAPASAGGPQVRTFDFSGKVLGQFMSYNPDSRTGVTVATGDVNGDGRDEIITAPAKGDKPEVRIFSSQGNKLNGFFAYSQDFRGGVNLATGDVNGDGRDEIITAPASAGGPQVRIFKDDGGVVGQFFALDKNLRGGFNLSFLPL